jgi:hypothetical protein
LNLEARYLSTLSGATGFSFDSASSREKPGRSATTAAQSVSTGAWFTRTIMTGRGWQRRSHGLRSQVSTRDP